MIRYKNRILPFPWVVLLLLFLGGGLIVWLAGPALWHMGQDLVAFASDEKAIESFVTWLGWLGPPVLILFNAIQIVVAPVPAYAMFGAAGFLYGPIWGGIYGTLGTLLGAATAMILTRRFGRPLAARMVGNKRLDRWGQLTSNRSLVVWGLLLLAPVGDVPYFLAGLSRVSLLSILSLTLITRVPTIFLIAAAASGTTSLDWWQLGLLLAGLLTFFGLLLRYQATLLAWFDSQVQRRLGTAEPTTAQESVTELRQ